MGEQELFNGLIATYRDLNLKVRPLPEERLTLGRSGESVRDVALQMRDEELRFSQALKDRLSGVSLTGAFGDKGETMLIEIPHPTIRRLRSFRSSARRGSRRSRCCGAWRQRAGTIASTVQRRFARRPRTCSLVTAPIWRRSSACSGLPRRIDSSHQWRSLSRRASMPAWTTYSTDLSPRQRNLELELLIAAQGRHHDGVSRRLGKQRLGKGRLALDALVANAEDDVTSPYSRLLRWASLDSRQNVGAVVDGEIILGGQIGRDRLILDANVGIRGFPVLNQLAGDIGDVVCRDREE